MTRAGRAPPPSPSQCSVSPEGGGASCAPLPVTGFTPPGDCWGCGFWRLPRCWEPWRQAEGRRAWSLKSSALPQRVVLGSNPSCTSHWPCYLDKSLGRVVSKTGMGVSQSFRVHSRSVAACVSRGVLSRTAHGGHGWPFCLRRWSKIYFVSWWLVSSVIWVNLFLALILEVCEIPAGAASGGFSLAEDGMGLPTSPTWTGRAGFWPSAARPGCWEPLSVPLAFDLWGCSAPGWGWGGPSGIWLLQEWVALQGPGSQRLGGVHSLQWMPGQHRRGKGWFMWGSHPLATLSSCLPEFSS